MIPDGRFHQIPENRHGLAAGAILEPTDVPITQGGQTSRDFVREQGGDEDTFIFLFGVRRETTPFGAQLEFIEGVFLAVEGPGFHPTWGIEQLESEIDAGGWSVVSTDEVLRSWTARVEERMNR